MAHKQSSPKAVKNTVRAFAFCEFRNPSLKIAWEILSKQLPWLCISYQALGDRLQARGNWVCQHVPSRF
jgi:hypothetical protein